ncbi:MAG: hypothetical protein ACKO3R_03555 [bacterium]
MRSPSFGLLGLKRIFQNGIKTRKLDFYKVTLIGFNLNTLAKLSEDFNAASSLGSEALCFSNDDCKRKLANGVMVYPWLEGLRKFFLKGN